MDPRDRELVAGLRAGDGAAAAEVESWAALAASPFRARLGAEWDDAVQDTLVELLDALAGGRFRGSGSLRGYVWRAVVRNCLDRLRRSRRWAFVEIDEEQIGLQPATAFSDLLRSESYEQLASLLGRVPRACRELWREILDGSSYREISARLGVAEGALRVRALRCRRRALELLRPDRGGNGIRAEAP